MLLSAVCFVANVLLIRAIGRAGTDGVVITALRFATGLALCLAFYRHELDGVALFRKPRLILRGLLGGAATYGFYLTVIHLGAGRATFLNNLYVVFSALLAVWVLRERFRPALAVGAGAALLGLGLLTGALSGLSRVGPYDGIALLGALTAAWIVVTIRQLHQEGVSTATIFASQCVHGLLLCAPLLVMARAWPDPLAAAGLVLGGVFAGVGQLTMTRAYRHLPVAEGALLQTIVPLGIAAGGVAFFGEHLGWADLLGGLLIVGGSVLPMLWTERLARRRLPEGAPPASTRA